MSEPPNFSDSAAVVEWVDGNLDAEGWEGLKVDLSANGYQGLVDWFDPLTDEERKSYVADPASRESVVQWLAEAPIAGAEPAAPGLEAAVDWSTDDPCAWAAEPATRTPTAERAADEPEPTDAAVAALGPGTWDTARNVWIYYDPARGWVIGDGRSLAEVDAAVAGDEALTTETPAVAEPTPPAAEQPTAEPAAATEEPPLPDLPDTTQAMVDEAISEEIAPVFDEAFSDIEGLDQLSPEDLREVLAAALAESGVSD